MNCRTYCFICVALLTPGLLPVTAVEAQLFYPSVNYGAGGGPWAIATGDLDGDSVPDLVTANWRSYTVSVLLGNGDGTFQEDIPIAGFDEPWAVAIGDLDGDGNQDLAVANASLHAIGHVSVLLGNGDGTFQTAVNHFSGDSPNSVLISDLNGDGDQDLAVVNYGSAAVSVHLGNGDGTFQTAIENDVDWKPYHVAAADLEGDGDLDLVTANAWFGTVSVLRGFGDGTFLPAVNYTADGSNGSTNCVAISDLNGDTHLDLVTANNGSSSVSVLLANGDGTFQTSVNYTVLDGPQGVAIGDLDDDGSPDLVVARHYSGYLAFLMGNGDGTFQAPVDSSHYAGGSKSVVIRDLDGDSDPDLAFNNYGYDCATVMLNSTVFELLSADLTCSPSSGTLPFITQMSVSLTNGYIGQVRRMAAKINIELAGGGYIYNWRAGWTNLDPGESFSTSWNQNLPALGALVGESAFTLAAEDVTPAPYNQPPYPPAGTTDTVVCTIQAVAP